MQLKRTPRKSDEAALFAIGLKSDREKQVSAAMARAKAAATKRARRQSGSETAPSLERSTPIVSAILPRIEVLFDQASPRALAVFGADPGTCRWPMGDGADFRFCGAPAVTGHRPDARTYCASCAALAYPGRARPSDLVKKAA